MDRREFFKKISNTVATVGIAGFAASCENLSGECSENCEELYRYSIVTDLCTACGTCLPQCGKNAIELSGEPNTVNIDQDLCIHCAACALSCSYESVIESEGTDGFNVNYAIDQDKCVQCLECYYVCLDEERPGAIYQSNPNRSRINQLKCSHCGECVELQFCPFGAIHENN
ncbi:MAG: 4Fe-4S binding protein [Deltaproteobacteria bacterium]|nr:4Fe-4S binding protein [Deltaproteobacteria bacterium]